MKNKYNVRTGLQRFMDKFPYWPRTNRVEVQDQFEYLGVGSMMITPIRLSEKGIDDEVDSQKSHNAKDI